MKITYGKTLTCEEICKIEKIASVCGIKYDTARLLFYRNYTTVESALKFFSAGKNNFLNPYDLSGMKEAVARIEKAKILGEKVLIYGDYDADGITAVSVLYFALKEYGIVAEFTVPERSEGYGINLEKIYNLQKDRPYDLIITVDCGISDCEKIKTLTSAGTDVIVTDHHEIPDLLPDCTLINPKLSGQKYSFQGLCGAGVAFKLASALIGEKAYKYLDIVTLATFADSMDLIEENRDIVVEGLKIFNSNLRPCFKHLLGESNKGITSQTLVYALAPRINAGGRMGDANVALKLLTTEDESEIPLLAEKLNEYNVLRQALCDNVYSVAKEIIISQKLYKNEVIMVKNKDWQVGVIGIVAARLVEEFNRPVIVFAGDNGAYKGSARSVDGVNIFEVIENAKRYLIAFGGHSQAAGLSLTEENFYELERALCEYIREKGVQPSTEKEILVDWELEPNFDVAFMREIDKLEPFGMGNRKPLFTMNTRAVYPAPLKVDSPHYTFSVENFNVLHFNGEKDVFNLQLPLAKTLFIEMNYSIFKGKEYFKGVLKNYTVDYSDLSVLKNDVFYNEIEKIKKLTDDFNGKINLINSNEVSIESGFGTLYVVTDPENLNKYEVSGLNVYFNKIESCNYANAILVSPTEIPKHYEKIIYLDTPLTLIPSNAENYVVKDVLASSLMSGVKTSRDELGKIFMGLKKIAGRRYIGAYELAKTVGAEYGFNSSLFAIEVFNELNLTQVKDGRYFVNDAVFNPLTNSSIYNKISMYGKDYD